MAIPFLLWRVIAKRAWWLAAAMLLGALGLGAAAGTMVLQYLDVDQGAVLVLVLWSAAGAGFAGALGVASERIWRAVRRA